MGHDLVLVLEGQTCRDTMSGEEFETTVTVVLDGKEHRGAGGRCTKGVWRVPTERPLSVAFVHRGASGNLKTLVIFDFL